MALKNTRRCVLYVLTLGMIYSTHSSSAGHSGWVFVHDVTCATLIQSEGVQPTHKEVLHDTIAVEIRVCLRTLDSNLLMLIL